MTASRVIGADERESDRQVTQRALTRWVCTVAGAFAVVSLGAQQTPVRDNAQQRDTAVASTGTASISGIVVNDETPGQPVRRAAVTLTGGPLTSSQTEPTDDNGAFAFRELPPGRYTLAASRPSFVRMAYGARRHDRSRWRDRRRG